VAVCAVIHWKLESEERMFADSGFLDYWTAVAQVAAPRMNALQRSAAAGLEPARRAAGSAQTRWLDALSRHWPEYLMEAAELSLFMISACFFGVLLEHPDSPVRQAIADPLIRRILMGLAMGGSAMAIIYSPWGQRSGAHFNPAVTLTFFRLGKVERWDAIYYILAQFVGGIAGVYIATLFLRERVAHPAVQFVATLPGMRGEAAAFFAELAITFLLMSVVLRASNSQPLTRWTGLFAGALVCLYISFEAPVSGMSMNPARTFGSAFFARIWTALWIYFTAPPLGMLMAAELYLRQKGLHSVFCAKLHHCNSKRCIFRCNFGSLAQTAGEGAQS
jgi:aquaporin Z